MTEADIKSTQLNFREAEIAETIKLFAQLNAGDAPFINLKPDSPREALPGFKNRLDLSAVTVAGHSYGATGVLQALKNAGQAKGLALNGGIALDPGKSSGPLNKDIEIPLLVMQSGEWTEKQMEFYGQGWHFDVVKKIVDSVKEGWFMTLSKFPSPFHNFTDVSSWDCTPVMHGCAAHRALDHEARYWNNIGFEDGPTRVH
jgi:platelet-activating factor acetylhydrolase